MLVLTICCFSYILKAQKYISQNLREKSMDENDRKKSNNSSKTISLSAQLARTNNCFCKRWKFDFGTKAEK